MWLECRLDLLVWTGSNGFYTWTTSCLEVFEFSSRQQLPIDDLVGWAMPTITGLGGQRVREFHKSDRTTIGARARQLLQEITYFQGLHLLNISDFTMCDTLPLSLGFMKKTWEILASCSRLNYSCNSQYCCTILLDLYNYWCWHWIRNWCIFWRNWCTYRSSLWCDYWSGCLYCG